MKRIYEKADKEVEAMKARAEFAIFCRNIRLFISKNPGTKSIEIRKALGSKRCDIALSKMLAMEIIRCEIEVHPDRTRTTKWFVVPQ